MAEPRSPRVVDFSTHFSGPIASQLLVQLGADVVKIENPRTGDGNRGLRPLWETTSIAHLAMNSGARSLAIDRRSPHWQEVIDAAARWADVVIVGAQQSAAKGRGMDFETLVQANPHLIYCAITGYGETGPWSSFPAHGLNLDVYAGDVPVEWVGDMPMARADFKSVGTTLAGVHAALAIFAALHRQREKREPQYIGVSIWGSAMWWNWRHLTTYANLGRPWHAYRDLGSRYCMYPTADHRAVLVCPTEKKYWLSFCDAVGLPEDRKNRGSWDKTGMDYGTAEEKPEIAERMKTRTLAEWTEILEKAAIPFAPVLTFVEAMESEHARANEVMATTSYEGKSARIPAFPAHFRSYEGGTVSPAHRPMPEVPPPPHLGEHTGELLQELGLGHLAGRL